MPLAEIRPGLKGRIAELVASGVAEEASGPLTAGQVEIWVLYFLATND